MKPNKRLSQYPLIILFVLFMAGLSLADPFFSKREYSEMENRPLTQFPKFSFRELFSNQYTPKYEKYVNDQFVGRDLWITIKSVSESAFGKIENNGVIYAKQDYMFPKYLSLDEKRYEANIDFVSRFLKGYSDRADMTVAIAPNAYVILDEFVPAGLHNVDQRAGIADIYDRLPDSAQTLDLITPLAQASEQGTPNLAEAKQDIYYHTDHHWTTYGSYTAYCAFVESKGKTPVSLDELDFLKREVPSFYGTYYSKSKKFNAPADTITWYDIPVQSVMVGDEEKGALYNQQQWNERDKHAAFLWGNNRLTVIRSDNNQNHAQGKTSRILVIKDSYANSFIPFLTYNYDEVYVLDLRYMDGKMSDFMREYEFDDVLLLYNFDNFTSDSNMAYLTY